MFDIVPWIAIQAHFYRDQTRFLVNSVYLDVAKRLIEMLCKSCEELLNRKSLESPLLILGYLLREAKEAYGCLTKLMLVLYWSS